MVNMFMMLLMINFGKMYCGVMVDLFVINEKLYVWLICMVL